MISAASLLATKQLLRLVLQRERETLDHGAPLTVAASAELVACLKAVPSEDLLTAIRRHRLELILQGDLLVSALLPQLAGRLNALAKAETMAALGLASLTRELAALFEQAGIPMLVIKGVPLSLQTTGSLTARGRGDLDLLVDPRQVGAAIELLQREGFVLPYGPTCVGDPSLQGHYSRWVSIELSLRRDHHQQRQWIDLHWHPSHVREVLPRFDDLWKQRERVKINDQAVVTLPNPWAFVHACCHAMTDRWSSLRHLVDVERLSRSVGSDCFERGKIPMRSVLKTCCVAAELTEATLVHDIARQASAFQRHKALRMAEVAQRRGWRSLGEGEWTLRNRIRYSLHHLNLSHHPSHWLSMALHHMVPPSALVDGQQGTYRSAWGVLKNRMFRLGWRLGDGHDNRLPAPAPERVSE
jgi:hypothetical protein